MAQLLAGDTGGTKTILRWVEADPTTANLETLYEERYTSAEFTSLSPMVKQFFQEAATAVGKVPIPERACFSIAGPVVNNTCNLTNLSWLLDSEELKKELNIGKVSLLNDFAAVGYGITGLKPDDICTLQTGEPQADAPIAVIGAGTGLGEGFLIRQPSGDYQIYGTEGGHTDFAPRNELEFQMLKYLRDKMGLARISVERVVSGMGIVAIYQFLRDRQTLTESEEVSAAIRTWEREAGKSEKSVDPGAVIAIAAQNQDALCQKTMELFVELYGAEAGNLALKLLPYGGLYIAGGVAAKNLPLMQSGIFMRAMNDKGRMRSLIERIPVYMILDEKVGLLGAALCALKL